MTFVGVEFTKLSPHRKWSKDARQQSANYIPFPSDKRNLPFQKYFNKASPQGRPASSSIPGEIKTAKNIAEQAEKKVSKFYKKARNWTLGGAIAGIIAITALVFASWDLISNANQHVAAARDEVVSLRKEQTKSDKKIELLEAQIKSLTESSKNN